MTEFSNVAVIGGGIMGSGLATHFAANDVNTTVIEHRESNVVDAKKRIKESVRFLRSETGTDISQESVFENLSFTLDPTTGVANVGLVLETISENLDAKRAVFRDIANATDDGTVLASNTSGIPITEIADGVPEAADRIIGCHWWNPPYLMPLVEVIKGEETAVETVDQVTTFVESVNRDPIVVNRDVPGFVWNRIQFAVLRECMHLVEEDVASLEDVNKAVRDGYALRTAVVGPFETVDLSGLELFQTIAGNLYPELSDADDPSRIFDEYLAEGRPGVEEGAGFFEYDRSGEEVVYQRDETIAALREVLSQE